MGDSWIGWSVPSPQSTVPDAEQLQTPSDKLGPSDCGLLAATFVLPRKFSGFDSMHLGLFVSDLAFLFWHPIVTSNEVQMTDTVGY